MPEEQGPSAFPLAESPRFLDRGSEPRPWAPNPATARRGAACAGASRKLAEARSGQYGLNVLVAGLLLLLAWAVHASGVDKSDLLCALTALMLLQLLWMAWYVGRTAAHRRLFRLQDAHAGARWLLGECPLAGPPWPLRPLQGPCPLPSWTGTLSSFPCSELVSTTCRPARSGRRSPAGLGPSPEALCPSDGLS